MLSRCFSLTEDCHNWQDRSCKTLGTYQGCPDRGRAGAALKRFPGQFDRVVWREPLAFAADAVSLWDLNRLSPVNRSVAET